MMKKLIFTLILAFGFVSKAAVLDCSARKFDYETQEVEEKKIEITPNTNGKINSESGKLLIGDFKFFVFRVFDSDLIYLTISKLVDINDILLPYKILSSSSSYGLKLDQKISLDAPVEASNLEVSCSLK
jgi:hypothetical protein